MVSIQKNFPLTNLSILADHKWSADRCLGNTALDVKMFVGYIYSTFEHNCRRLKNRISFIPQVVVSSEGFMDVHFEFENLTLNGISKKTKIM